MRTIEHWAYAALAILAGACSGQVANSVSEDARTEAGESARARQGDMRIRIIVNGRELTAELEDSAAARDFVALLPIELTLRDYHGTEMIADLPSRLSIEGAPEGIDPSVGDLAYYAPWGNLALFYRDFGYSRGLVRLGRIEGDVAGLAGAGPVPVRIEPLPVAAH